jgi:replicative DNA helicase
MDMEIFNNFMDNIKEITDEERNEIKFYFDSCYKKQIDNHKFKYSTDQILIENRNEYLTKTLSNLSLFHKNERMDEIVSVVKEMALKIEDFKSEQRPEGNIISKEYVDKIKLQQENKIKLFKEGKLSSFENMLSGIKKIDEETMGIKKHDFWLWVGFAGEGKTMMLKEFAYNAAFIQKKNVVVITLEMSDDDWFHMIYCRHSHKFYKDEKGFTGVDYRLIRDEPYKMTKEQKEAYDITLNDAKEGEKNGKYGKMYVFFPETSATIDDIENKLNSLQRQFQIDLVVIDYISILTPKYFKSDPKKSLGRLFVDAKQLAQNFNNGKGVALISAHQTNREGWERAKKRGYYVKSDLSDTSEAEKNASVLGYILQTDESMENKELILGIIKHRFGRNGGPWRTVNVLDKCLVGNIIEEEQQHDFLS